MVSGESPATRDPVLEEVFLDNFPYYFQSVVRLRRLPMQRCHREYEDIRSEGIQNYLEARSGELARQTRLRLAVRALSRACYSQVERTQRRHCDALPPVLAADPRTSPLEHAHRREIRARLARVAPELKHALFCPESYLSTGRLSKSALMRSTGISRRQLLRALGRVHRSLARSLRSPG